MLRLRKLEINVGSRWLTQICSVERCWKALRSLGKHEAPLQLEENNLPESAEPGSSPSVCWLLTWLFPLNSKRKVVFNKIIYSVSRNYSYLGINKTRKKMLFSEIEPISFEDCVLSFFKEYNQGTIVILAFGEKGFATRHSNFSKYSKRPFSKKPNAEDREEHSKFPRLTCCSSVPGHDWLKWV